MTVTDQIKILNRKIKQNEAQYDLDRKAAKISALCSNNSDKYEYLTWKDLDLKPGTVEKTKFEYFPLGKIFNKGLDKEEKKERLLKRLKNIEDKNEELLKTTKNKTENVKEITDSARESLSSEAKALAEEIRIIQKDVDYKKLKITGGNNVTCDFSDYKTFKELLEDLYFKKMTIDEAEMKQDEFNSILAVFSNYTPKSQKYIEAKNSLLSNAKNFCEGRGKIIKGFKDGIFLLKSDKKTDEQPNTADMPELESEESAEQRRNQQGQGLKILTPKQMLSRLPISLAQLKAGNNSEKLKNENRQLLYSLYRSKKLTK